MDLLKRYDRNRINCYLHIGDIAIVTAYKYQLEAVVLDGCLIPGEKIIICSELKPVSGIRNCGDRKFENVYSFKLLDSCYSRYILDIPAAFIKIDKENKLWTY